MKLIATLLFLSSLLFVSQAVSLTTATSTTLSTSASSQLKSMLESFKPSTKFGQDFLSTLSLKLQSGDKIDAIVSFIKDLRDSLQSDQSSDDNVSYTKNTFWNNSITELNWEISVMTDEIATLQLEVDQMNLDYTNYQKETDILNKELALLDEKQQTLENLRAQDVIFYNTRVSRQNNMIFALNVIISNLTYIVDSQSFISKSQVVDELKKLGKDQALIGLITLSTSFTPTDLNKIIQKLKEIKTALTASVAEDDAYEQVAQTNFLNLIAEFETCRSNVQNSLDDIANKMADLLQKIANDQNTIADDQAQITVAQQQVDEYTKQQNDFNALYQTRFTARNADMTTINNALEIVQVNAATVRGLVTSPQESQITL